MSRHNSHAPWEFLCPDTSCHRTPWWWQVSPIFQHSPNHDTPCYNRTTCFGTVSNIAGEFQILVHGNFFTKNSTALSRMGRGLCEGKRLFWTDLIIPSLYITASLNSPACTSPNGSKGGCSSSGALRILYANLAWQQYSPPVSCLLLPHAFQLMLWLTSLLLHPILLSLIDNNIITLLLKIEKMQLNDQQNGTKCNSTINKIWQTSCQSRIGLSGLMLVQQNLIWLVHFI